MSIYKITVSAFIGIPLCLLVLALLIKQPHVAQYEQTITELMASGQFASEAEILEQNPSLAAVKSQMRQEAQLKAEARAKVCSPLPPVSIAEQEELVDQLQRTHHLRTEIIQRLQHFALDTAARVIKSQLQP